MTTLTPAFASRLGLLTVMTCPSLIRHALITLPFPGNKTNNILDCLSVTIGGYFNIDNEIQMILTKFTIAALPP